TITTIQRPFWLRKYKEIDDLNTKIVELKNDQSLVGYWALAYAWNRFKPLYNRHYSLLANYKRCSFLREGDLYELVAVTNSSQGTYPLLDAGNELNRNEKHLDDVRSTLNTGNSNSEDRGQLKDCFTLVMPRIEKFIVDFKTMNAALKCSESYRK